MWDRNSLTRDTIIGLMLFCAFVLASCTPPNAELGTASYQTDATTKRCEPGSRMGPAGSSNSESTAKGIRYNVRTPSNYDPTVAHPLLVVYAPATANRWRTERITRFTPTATANGFIVAYADHPRLSKASTIELGTIPERVSKQWCIDNERVFLTGHSDGGTVATALAFMDATKQIPAAIAPSAAGVTKADFLAEFCPEPLPVMVMHSANDRLFPGYGAESAEWWAACNGCDVKAEKTQHNGCEVFTGCQEGADVWYCEGQHDHARWPDLSPSVIEFFAGLGPND